MSRWFEQIEERAREDLAGAKAALKRLGDRHRAHLLAWLCTYYGDDGALLSPQLTKTRRRIVLDGVEYWLAKVPKRS